MKADQDPPRFGRRREDRAAAGLGPGSDALHSGRDTAQLALREAEQLRRELERRNADLRTANEHLVVAAMDAQRLSEAAERAEQSRHQAEAFIAMLSHELRNPLAPISTAIGVLDRVDSTDGRIAWVGDMVRRQVAQLSRLLDDLLEASRVTTGKIELQRAPCDLAVVVGEALESCGRRLEERGQDVRVDLAGEPMIVDGDAVRLMQVVCNLIINASKYTPDGGAIAVTLRRSGADATITVRDNGVGMSSATIPRIFDLFVQVDTSLSRSRGGLGIGLTVVKRLVELHGGTVTASSEGIERGSTFEVKLPLIAAVVTAPVERRPANASGGAGCRVALIDDNADANFVLGTLLGMSGYDVVSAFDGLAGLEVIVANAPDVVLCDIGLPRLDGYEVARRVRAMPEPHPVLIAITGYGQSEDHQRSLDAGFDIHLVKPVDPDELLRILARVRVARRPEVLP